MPHVLALLVPGSSRCHDLSMILLQAFGHVKSLLPIDGGTRRGIALNIVYCQDPAIGRLT